jgi:DUF1016 N-terminal domain
MSGVSSGASSGVSVPKPPDLYEGIREVLLAARTKVRQTVNTAMVQTYWQIGRLIVEGEQGGELRATYGKTVLPDLARRLTAEFGKGFSAPSLWGYRQFYLEFPILSTAWRELSWSHFRMLSRVKNERARTWYANEAVTQGWSVRALDRHITTLFYEPLVGSCRIPKQLTNCGCCGQIPPRRRMAQSVLFLYPHGKDKGSHESIKFNGINRLMESSLSNRVYLAGIT